MTYGAWLDDGVFESYHIATALHRNGAFATGEAARWDVRARPKGTPHAAAAKK